MRSPKDVKKFMDWYNAAIPEHESHKDAYEATEMAWRMEYGVVFYKTYESFRAAKSYYNRFSKRLSSRNQY